MTRDVAIVVVGDEILQGRRTEANAAWLARALQGMGVQLSEVRVVSDTHDALQKALTDLRSPLRTVLVTGGLGPTRDDRTREEVARAFGQKVVRSREALAMVRSAYRKRNIELDPAGEIQGDLPEGAILIPNPAGTAPSFLVMDDGYRVVCMPGVPREMQAIFQATVKGLLASSADAPGIARLFTHGLGESMQEEKMRDLALEDVEFCSLPGPWGVEIQCLVRGESATREERAHAALKLVADRLGDAQAERRAFEEGEEDHVPSQAEAGPVDDRPPAVAQERLAHVVECRPVEMAERQHVVEHVAIDLTPDREPPLHGHEPDGRALLRRQVDRPQPLPAAEPEERRVARRGIAAVGPEGESAVGQDAP